MEYHCFSTGEPEYIHDTFSAKLFHSVYRYVPSITETHYFTGYN